MFVIGITGGIGTGKSAVSRILEELGVAIIDADRVGHEVYRPQSKAWKQIVANFGQEVLQPSGEIDRKLLGAIVFSDPEARATLNAIVHPCIYQRIELELEKFGRLGTEVVVVEAALLIEAGWVSLADEVWVVQSPEEVVVERLRYRNGLSEEGVLSRIGSQMSFEERRRYANVVVDNSGDMDKLQVNVRDLWESRVKGKVC